MSSAVRLELLESWGSPVPLEAVSEREDPGPRPDALAEFRRLRSDVRRVLAAMPPDHRALLVAVDLNELPETKVAAALGWSRGRVRRRLAEARLAARVALAAVRQ